MKIFDNRLVKLIKKVGIKKGDVVLAHLDASKSISLNKGLRSDLDYHFFSLKKVIGKSGTIVVPAYFYEYARSNKVFDVDNSPPSRDLGFFSLYAMKKKNKHRSINPITSLIAFGKYAKYIGSSSGSAFGYDSAFHRLYQLNAKMLFIGIENAMTFLHLPEYWIGAPHLYNKYYTTRVIKKGKKINLPITGQVRYLNMNVHYDSDEHTRIFDEAGLVKKAKLTDSFYIRSMQCDKIFNFLIKELKKNSSYLLRTNPKFKKNQIPIK